MLQIFRDIKKHIYNYEFLEVIKKKKKIQVELKNANINGNSSYRCSLLIKNAAFERKIADEKFQVDLPSLEKQFNKASQLQKKAIKLKKINSDINTFMHIYILFRAQKLSIF